MLATEGARVALAGRRAAELSRVREQIEVAGGVAITVPADLRRDEELSALLARTQLDLGTVDILVNNAGIIGSATDFRSFHEIGMDECDEVLAINLRAAVLLLLGGHPTDARPRPRLDRQYCERGWRLRLPRDECVRVSKHALRVLMELIDAEYGQRGITAWAVCPGLVGTRMGLAEHPSHPEHALTAGELAEVVRSLFQVPEKVKLGPQVLVRTKQILMLRGGVVRWTARQAGWRGAENRRWTLELLPPR